MKTALVEKIKSKNANIGVIGLGNVGLPTAAVFAEAGFNVTGVDVDEEVVKAVNEGRSEIKELELNELVGKVVKRGKLKATLDVLQAVKEADIMIICVQTPLTKKKKPDLTFLEKACRTIAQGLMRDKLVIVGSTVPPGTTKKRVASVLETESGLKCGVDFWLAHCPERLTRGKVLQEFVQNDRIIGGFNEESGRIAAELFKAVLKGNILITDCTTTETAKLAENAFRDVNIAFANELTLICEQIGLDAMEVIKLANTHPRVNIHKPGGVGGPCLPKDPYLLLYPAEEKGFKSRVIKPARELNDYMSRHALELVVKALRESGKDVSESKVAVLGVAYKGDVDETRNSPSEMIVGELMRLGAEVVVYDPYCEESFDAEKAGSIADAVKGADCVVIATDHEMFKNLDLQRIKALMNEKPAFVDGKRIVSPEEAKKHGFVYFGVGYGESKREKVGERG